MPPKLQEEQEEQGADSKFRRHPGFRALEHKDLLRKGRTHRLFPQRDRRDVVLVVKSRGKVSIVPRLNFARFAITTTMGVARFLRRIVGMTTRLSLRSRLLKCNRLEPKVFRRPAGLDRSRGETIAEDRRPRGKRSLSRGASHGWKQETVIKVVSVRSST